MWGILLENILLVIILKHTGDSYIVSNRRRPGLFLRFELKFPSYREYFLVRIFILLSLVILGPCGRGAKLGNKWNNKSYETILWAVTHPGPLVWLVVYTNHFACLPGTFQNQCTMQTASVRIEWGFSHFNYFQLCFHHNLLSGTCPFCSLIYYSYFIHPIHRAFFLDGSFAFHQISLPYCAWGTNANFWHFW